MSNTVTFSEEKTFIVKPQETLSASSLDVHCAVVCLENKTLQVQFVGQSSPQSTYASGTKPAAYEALESTAHAAILAMIEYAGENSGL